MFHALARVLGPKEEMIYCNTQQYSSMVRSKLAHKSNSYDHRESVTTGSPRLGTSAGRLGKIIGGILKHNKTTGHEGHEGHEGVKG
jgi:hypothetical protein